MKSYIECYPCFLKQAVEASKMATHDESIRWNILQEVFKKIPSFSPSETPAIIGKEIHSIVRELSANPDPYHDVKKEYNQKAKDLIPFIEQGLKVSQNKLLSAIKLLAIANIIDFGPFGLNQVNFKEFLSSKMDSDFKGSIAPINLIKAIKKAKSVLYVADNCGEIIIDAFFINAFLKDKRVYLSVRGGVVLNDATKEDLRDIDLSNNVTVLSNNDNAPGVILENSSKEFLDIYNKADLVILKGQGNFEGIGVPRRDNIYSILVAKCPVIARHIGCNVNDLIITIPG